MPTCKQCRKEFTGKRKDAQYCSQTCGNNFRNQKARKLKADDPTFQALKRDQADKDRNTPYGKYVQHKHRAKQSGVAFNLTFNQWWNIWKPHWDERGLGKLVMCRLRDSGAYEVGNVRIDTQANNNREAHNLRRNQNG